MFTETGAHGGALDRDRRSGAAGRGGDPLNCAIDSAGAHPTTHR